MRTTTNLCETRPCFDPDAKLASLACGISFSDDTLAHTVAAAQLYMHSRQIQSDARLEHAYTTTSQSHMTEVAAQGVTCSCRLQHALWPRCRSNMQCKADIFCSHVIMAKYKCSGTVCPTVSTRNSCKRYLSLLHCQDNSGCHSLICCEAQLCAKYCAWHSHLLMLWGLTICLTQHLNQCLGQQVKSASELPQESALS